MKPIIVTLLTLLISFAVYAEDDKVILQLNLEKENTYYLDISVKSNIAQDFMGMKMDMAMQVNGKLAYKVMADLGDAYELEAKYLEMSTQMASTMEMMGQVIETPSLEEMLEEINNSLTYRPFTVIMAKTGKVLNVSGMDQVIEEALIDLPFGSYDERLEVISQVKQISGDQSIAGNLEMASIVFPDKALTLGYKWDTTTQMTGAFSATLFNTYEIKEIHNDWVLVSGISVFSADEEESTLEFSGIEMDMDMTGNMYSTIKVDRITGWIISSNIFQEIDGLFIMGATPELPEGLEIQMKMISSTQLSGMSD